jgi:O-acetyl-ADP-ribose deacetylase (regulator of RNase III)
MKIIYCNGNLLDAQTDVIAHQVNCQGVMGSGVAKQIREKWANVYTAYRAEYDLFTDLNKPLLGNCQLVQVNDHQYVANLFGQDKYGYDGKRYTSYDGIYDTLTSLTIQMMDNGMESLAIPYKMSSDRGGADWNIILAMIESVFKNTNITIEIWQLEQD